MFRSIKKANEEINSLRLQNSELKSKLFENENNVSSQDFCDMRLRAQKAELALEAITQANIDSRLRINEKNAREREDVKTSIVEAFMSHMQNFKVN